MTKKEREFVRLLLQQDAQIKRLYSETVTSMAGHLNRFKSPTKSNITPENIWVRNKAIESRIDKLLNDFQLQLESVIKNTGNEALIISKQYSDEIISSYLARLPISQISKEGIFARSLEAFEQFQKKGFDISPQVWKTAKTMKDQLAFYGASGVASGQSSRRISTDLKDYLQNPDKRFRRVRDPETGKLKLSQPAKNFHPGQGVYRSSYQNALRLAQTEVNMTFRHADQARWKEMPFVNGYEVKLSSQHPEPDICDEMAGPYPKNFLFGGWHPKCICYTVPVMAPTKDFVQYLKTGNLNESKIISSIPGRAERYVEKMSSAYSGYKSKPYFIKDNFTLKKGIYQVKKSAVKTTKVKPTELIKEATN